MESLLLLLLVIAIALVLVVLHKVRRIHQASFELLSLARDTWRETSALFAQLHALSALERHLHLEFPLPPLRGWAGSPDFLLQVTEELLSTHPMTVVECSSGVSTVVAARCMQLNGQGHVYSLEHDAMYASKTRGLLLRHGLRDWATVLDAPLSTAPGGAPWYSLESIPSNMSPIDVLVVDGPPLETAPLARLPALPRLADRMAGAFTVFLDDADRAEERATIEQWCALYPALELTRPPAEKGLAVLRMKR